MNLNEIALAYCTYLPVPEDPWVYHQVGEIFEGVILLPIQKHYQRSIEYI